ncbi:Rieske (2Fe-2S) protein [Algoriphagus sp. CAU 1675]|uniref:Rieske (2Fe-2S) protein n=1 Tax=Algoriphagus sp. CAU 1675 TaxID=3032597 RepID=UPI0023DC0E7A|nr:Rieske (2Fe-2S) protein [Algoriphagus sp. CAU 1675]MDF2156680.1 Rieske (2Fe-2S) protein [Algoriphagus sp. CAU 1675]
MKEYYLGKSKEEALRLLPENKIIEFPTGEESIAVLRTADAIYAFEASCPHRGASLLQGSLHGSEELICPLHRYRFDLKTGQVLAGFCGDLTIYPTELTERGLKILC